MQMNDFFKTVRSFLLVYLPNQRCYSENTVKSYRTTLNLMVEFLCSVKLLEISQINFASFNRDIIQEFIDWLGTSRNYTARSCNQRLMALRTFFEYAGFLDCTQIAVHIDVKKIQVKKEPGRIVYFLTENALKTLLIQPDIRKSTSIRNRFFMVLMYDTAARCGEMLNLRVRDLNITTKHPVAHLLGKGNKPRIVSLLNKTVEHYKQYLQLYHPSPKADDYLYYTSIHGIRHQMSADAVAMFMKKYGKTARAACLEVPEKVHPHQLRHTRAIHYYRDGMPLSLIAELLGYASVKTTKIYAYADSEMKRIAMEKADAKRNITGALTPVWQDDNEMILRLSGLK
jgi:site-specific recombinase XerD